MKAVIGKWIAWLRSAAAGAGQLAHVYSDGARLWAGDGHRLHALDVATERPGRVTVGEEGTLQVEDGDVPPFLDTLPQGEPVASVVVSATALRAALAGQEGMVRLRLYGEEEALEVAGAGRYALVMPATGAQPWWFWRPGEDDNPPPPGDE